MYKLSAFAPRSICLLDAPTNRPPLQAFACSPLGRSDRTPFQACDLRSNAPPARLSRRSASAFPSPPDRLPGVRPPTGSASGRLAAPPPPPSAGSLCSALLRSAPWVVFCLRSAPTMSEKKIAKGFAFHNFFSNKTPLIQQFILFLRCK